VSVHCLRTARAALSLAPVIGDPAYPAFARSLAAVMTSRWPQVAAANAQDLAAGRERGLPESWLHRMCLTEAHRDGTALLAERVVAELAELARHREPTYRGAGGTVARRVARPLGVLLMIYEARPTVTIDGAMLPACVGNAVLLRGGAEIARTNAALADVIAEALARAGLPPGLVQVLPDLDRTALRELLLRDDAIDVLIPRGSPSLLDACRSLSRIPMIVGGDGVNHMYVHAAADLPLAVRLLLDGKLPEPDGCTALEMVLLDSAIAGDFLELLAARAADPGLESLVLRVGADLLERLPAALTERLTVEPLTEADLGREFLSPTLAVASVAGPDAAITHVVRYGTGHTDAIVTQDEQVAEEFCRKVDSAAVIVNGSVRLHDGPTLGLGTEIVISTGRLHARGPVTAGALMTYGWRVDGHGAVRFGDEAAGARDEGKYSRAERG